MSSKDRCDKSTRAGIFVVIALALLLIVMLCAVFFPGDSSSRYQNGRPGMDDSNYGSPQGVRERAGRGLGEVM